MALGSADSLHREGALFDPPGAGTPRDFGLFAAFPCRRTGPGVATNATKPPAGRHGGRKTARLRRSSGAEGRFRREAKTSPSRRWRRVHAYPNAIRIRRMAREPEAPSKGGRSLLALAWPFALAGN